MKHIHFIGIGGIGMSGIAQILIAKGFTVSGSDLKSSHITVRLEGLGATVFYGHAPENIKGADTVVISSAIPKTNCELIAAKVHGLNILQRAEMLSFLMNDQLGIAVSGTHGKTTTTSMISHVMNYYNMQPTTIVGGELSSISSNAALGRGTYLIAEADESDASFLHLSPLYAVITNIDSDVNLNVEPYSLASGDPDRLMQIITDVFLDFTNRVFDNGKVILCTDSEVVRHLLPKVTKEIVTYSINHDSDLKAENISLSHYHSTSDIYYKSEYIGQLTLLVPGRHNVQNALACIAVAREVGLSFEQILEALKSFGGLRRRFEVLGTVNGIMVVDDYAHNPSKLRAAVHAASTGGADRIVAVFQPHRYTRTKFLLNELSEAFDEADIVVVTDIYAASEKPDPSVSGKLMAEMIQSKSPRANVYYISSHKDIVEWLKYNTKSGDIVITLGAGDIYKLSAAFYSELVGTGEECGTESTCIIQTR